MLSSYYAIIFNRMDPLHFPQTIARGITTKAAARKKLAQYVRAWRRGADWTDIIGRNPPLKHTATKEAKDYYLLRASSSRERVGYICIVREG